MAVDAPVLIDTARQAERMRARIIRLASREILVSRIAGSDQEDDLTSPVNAGGLGRVRHFQRATDLGWPDNPLPIVPAAASLGLPSPERMLAEVFQNAACAWRCWYCYVPFELLGGHERSAEWTTPHDLIARYAALPDRPPIVDLSGGSPDLTPEWVVWTMDALDAAGLADRTYLWSDDNLSTDYLFTELDDQQRRRLRDYRHYGRVCCLKGFDRASFAFNTGAAPEEFDRQFERFARMLDLGIDLYGYATLTGPSRDAIADGVPAFFDRLQRISPSLPLRVVPLKIAPFGPMLRRATADRLDDALIVQTAAVAVWQRLLKERFSAEQRALPVNEIRL